MMTAIERMNINNVHKANSVLYFLYFLSFLLIGADRISVSLNGNTVRVVQIVLIFQIVIIVSLNKYRLRLELLLLIFPFFIAHFLSAFCTYYFVKTVLYIFWLSYNFFIVGISFYLTYEFFDSRQVFFLYQKVFNVIGYMVILQFFLGLFRIELPYLGTNFTLGIPRPYLWFYEPSYLATFMGINFSINLFFYYNYKDKYYLRNLIKSIIFIFFITSTTGFVSIAISIFLFLFFSQHIRCVTRIKYIVIVSLVVLSVLLLFYFFVPVIIAHFIGRLFTSGIVASSGDRINEWGISLKAFRKHPILGVGAGAYEKYTGMVASNVSLEILASLGVVGMVGALVWFLIPFVYFYWQLTKRKTQSFELVFLKALLFSYFVFIITLQANQNYMRIYHWQLMGLIFGLYYKLKEGEKEKNKSVENCY